MFAKINNFFQSLNEPASSDVNQLSVEMACTVLLCEVMRADGELMPTEQALLSSMISEQFSLTKDEVLTLIQQATILSENAIDFHQFTSKINAHYNPKEKAEIVTLLWKLALADGEIASIEEHIIRRIADLLHLSHGQYIHAKNAIKQA